MEIDAIDVRSCDVREDLLADAGRRDGQAEDSDDGRVRRVSTTPAIEAAAMQPSRFGVDQALTRVRDRGSWIES